MLVAGSIAASYMYKYQSFQSHSSLPTVAGPFTSSNTPTDALGSIDAIKAQMQQLKEAEATLRRGLGIFKIDQPPSKEMTKLEHVRHSISQTTCCSYEHLLVWSHTDRVFIASDSDDL